MLDEIQYQVLKTIAPGEPPVNASSYQGKSKVGVYLGQKFLEGLKDKTVIDFGCGRGDDTLDLARLGAGKVIGIDIRPSLLEKAKERAESEGVADRCEFTLMTDTKADLVISIDAFEHFDDPQMILDVIHDHLKRNGQLILCFGPTWYHPRGGHLFSVFPWAHLVFSEKALCRWRSTIRSDGAMHFKDVEGGLNQMTIARFEKLVEASRFRLEEMEMIPIRPLRRIHNPLTREFTTSMVRAKLVPK